jgi:sialidase-1
MIQKTTVFEARKGGYKTYRVPGILATPGNTVLVTAEARPGGGDWGNNDIVLRRSIDGGVTWAERVMLVSRENYGPGPLSNFVMIHDAVTQCIHVLYCHNYEYVFYMRSFDEGISFSTPVNITHMLLPFKAYYPWRVIATGPGHGIQLTNGRLLVPVWMSDGSGTEFGPRNLGHRPSEVAVIYSDDHGATWQCGDFVAHTTENIINPSETIPVQLTDGRVLLNIRSESKENRRLISTSEDGATGWTDLQFDDALLEPVCMASILKLENSMLDPEPILFANPDNLENELTPGGTNLAHDRKRLTVKISTDDCQTWSCSRILEPGPSGYSDLAETPDGIILCVYEDGMMFHMTDTAAVTVARFDLEWLTDNL